MSEPADGDAVALRSAARRARADEWALVLAAEGLHPAVVNAPGGFAVYVPAAERERAQRALEAWEVENRRPARPELPDPALDPAAIGHALFVMAALVAFFALTGPARDSSPWFEAGSADARRLLAGEPWRAVTALTLHADLPHVLGNAVAGAVFLAGSFRAFGWGAGSLLVLSAGAGGNLLNAWLRHGPHDSVGASTAVFGALGVLSGRALRRGRARGLRGRAAWVPLAAALALLAMIGTEGERVDLWAHACGLAVGVVLGAAAAPLAPQLNARRWQWAAGGVAIAMVACAWLAALR